MKIYTRTGDTGSTGLFGGGRVPKDHPRVAAYGTLDELNALLGRALPALGVERTRTRLAQVQHDLFALGSHLAAPPPEGGRKRPELPGLPTERVAEMEAWIDEADGELPPLRAFILPGGCAGAAELHVGRTVCRRAERAVVGLDGPGGDPGGDPALAVTIRYLNRLSDLLFALARLENAHAGTPDIEWIKKTP